VSRPETVMEESSSVTTPCTDSVTSDCMTSNPIDGVVIFGHRKSLGRPQENTSRTLFILLQIIYGRTDSLTCADTFTRSFRHLLKMVL